MNQLKRRALPLLLAVLLLLPCLPAAALAAPSELPDVRCVCAGNEVALQKEGDQTYLFLPAAADPGSLTFTFQGDLSLTAAGATLNLVSGQPADLSALFSASPGTCDAVFQRGAVSVPVKIMQSQNIPALFLTSADAGKDRAWVEQNKENKAKGSAVLLKADGSVLYDGSLSQIKGRGNSTWERPKKPYQIKLDKATDLMECSEPAKTWILLANYFDRTLLRNWFSYELAEEIGLEYSPHCRPLDLYYDGEYRGSYLLSEKTELGKNRVDVHDLGADIEAVNPQIEDFEALLPTKGMTVAGSMCQYSDGLREPESVAGGYLIEVDLEDRAKEEATWFSTPMGLYITVKSPEYATRDAIRYVSTFWQYFEDAVVNGGMHPRTGQPYTAYMDEVSLAKMFLILELGMNGDAFRTSTYFYKDENEEKLFAGPIWDFDLAYGLGFTELSPETLVAGKMPIGKELLQVPSFRAELQKQNEELHHLVRDILLGGVNAHGRVLRSLKSYDAEISASRTMDQTLWSEEIPLTKNQRTTAQLTQILSQRDNWLYNYFQQDTGFTDVRKSDWFADSVEQVVQMGLFQGVTEDTFQPGTPMTRGMVATVLYRMAGSPKVTYRPIFTDVAQGRWYTDAVIWASGIQVVNGYPDKTFRPSAPITRQELVTLFYHYTSSTGKSVEAPAIPARFQDRNSMPLWASPAFGWAVDRGLVTGNTNAAGALVLDGSSQTPRSQGAALFLRLSNLLAQ